MSKAALITGVGRRRGIGAGLAAGLAEDGWDLVLSYWKPYDDRLGFEAGPDDPAAIARDLSSAHGVRVELMQADLADATVPDALVAKATSEVGPLSALVLSHCESVDSDYETTTVESFDRHYAVNVRAGWLLIRAFGRQAPPAGGAVVALTSDHTVGNLPYGATKGALDRVVLAAAQELAPKRVRANVVNPGPVDTGWMTTEVQEMLQRRQLLGRLGTPTDTANLVRFLVSDAGCWMNGQLLHCDGGLGA